MSVIDYRKHEPNISVTLPGWDEVCTDVLALPIRIQTKDADGYYWTPDDGELGAAVAELQRLYHAQCEPSKLITKRSDGSEEEEDCILLDEDLLVRRIFGQAYDPELRAAFARCLRAIGADPAEIIPLGERVFAEYTQQEADRLIAEGQAMEQVDRLYGEMLPQYLQGDVLKYFRHLLMRMVQFTGKVPEVMGVIGTSREIYLAVKDIEAMIGNKFPGGAWLPEYVTMSAGRRYLSLNALMVFSLGPLQKLYFAHEDDEAINTFHSCCCHLQYSLLNSTPEGRQALDKALGGLFGGGIQPEPGEE